MTSEYYLALPGNVHIGLSSTSDLGIQPEEELLLGAYLPGVTMLDSAPPRLDFTVHHVASTNHGIQQTNTELWIEDERLERFLADLPHVLYAVARGLWLERGLYSAHAACVGIGESYTLLPGHSGAGKSSLCLQLLTKHDFRLFSGNTTLLSFDEDGIPRAVAGTPTMTLRSQDFAEREFAVGTESVYGERTAFLLDGGLYAATKTVDITSVFLPRLTHGTPTSSTLSPANALHTLYPYLLDVIHANVVLAGGHAVFIDRGTDKARRQLARHLQRALTWLPVRDACGNSAQLAEMVAR